MFEVMHPYSWLSTCIQAPMYYRGSNAAVIVYDITNPSSFEDVKTWIDGAFFAVWDGGRVHGLTLWVLQSCGKMFTQTSSSISSVPRQIWPHTLGKCSE